MGPFIVGDRVVSDGRCGWGNCADREYIIEKIDGGRFDNGGARVNGNHHWHPLSEFRKVDS